MGPRTARCTGNRQERLPNTTKTVAPSLTPTGTSDINQAYRVSEARKNGPEMGRRRQHLLTTTQIQRDNNDRKSDMTWLTTAEDSSKWVALESDFTSSRLKQPARPTTLITTTTTTQQTTRDRTTVTTKTCDQNEDDTKDDDEQDGTPLILSQ